MSKKNRITGFIFNTLVDLYVWAALRKHQNFATRAVRSTVAKRLPLHTIVTSTIRKKLKK